MGTPRRWGPGPAGEPGRDALQALRVVAIALLIAYHAVLLVAAGPGWAGRLVAKLGEMGWIGTDLLLALAGFLAVGARVRAGGTPAWLVRRAARVLPLFLSFLLAYLYLVPLVLAHLGTPESASAFAAARAHQLWSWALATNLQMATGARPGVALEPLLTLSLGAQLTIGLALLLRPTPRWLGPAALVLLECVAIALRLAWRHDDPWRTYGFPLTRCDAFLAGVALAWASSHPRWGDPLRRHAGKLAAAGAVLLLGAVLATRGLSPESSAASLVAYPAIGLFAGAVVLWLAQVRRCPARPAARLGDAMFGVYLVKLPVLFAVRALLLPGAPAGPAAALLLATAGGAAAVAVGGALHLGVERPLVAATFAALARRPHAWWTPGARSGALSGSAP